MSKPRRILAVLAFAVALALGAAPAAFADEGEGEGAPPPISIGGDASNLVLTLTKRLELPYEGMAVPNETFTFGIEQQTPDAPDATVENIVFESRDNILQYESAYKNNLIGYVDRQAKIKFEEFKHAGVFSYKLNEVMGENDDILYSLDTYTIYISIVNNDEGGLDVSSVFAANGGGNKLGHISFTNEYFKTGTVTVSKKVVGDLGDKTKDFDFKFALIAIPGSEQESVTGYIGNEPYHFPLPKGPDNNLQWVDFNLKDGQSLVIEDIPVGSRYLVSEMGHQNGYIATAVTFENGDEYENSNNVDGASVTSGGKHPEYTLVGEGKNSFEVTNTYSSTPITGVIMRNAPFAALLGLGVAALVALAIVKRRRTQRLG